MFVHSLHPEDLGTTPTTGALGAGFELGTPAGFRSVLGAIIPVGLAAMTTGRLEVDGVALVDDVEDGSAAPRATLWAEFTTPSTNAAGFESSSGLPAKMA